MNLPQNTTRWEHQKTAHVQPLEVDEHVLQCFSGSSLGAGGAGGAGGHQQTEYTD